MIERFGRWIDTTGDKWVEGHDLGYDPDDAVRGGSNHGGWLRNHYQVHPMGNPMNGIRPAETTMEDARGWAKENGFDHWFLVSPKDEWLLFCRRPDGAVFVICRFTSRDGLTTLPREKFIPVREYVMLWRRFREAGWTETRGSNDA